MTEPRSVGGGYPVTPDERYFVVRGRLWRMANPELSPQRLRELVNALMAARRQLRGTSARPEERARARSAVHHLKVELGERGPPWWADGAPDYNRHMVENSPYREWYAD